MTAAEAHAAAAAEGLSLVSAENSTGFKGVFRNNNISKPFEGLRHLGAPTAGPLRDGGGGGAGRRALPRAGGRRGGLEPAAPEPTPMTAAEARGGGGGGAGAGARREFNGLQGREPY